MSDIPSYPREASEREALVQPPEAQHALASWGRRAAAYALDVLILLLPIALLATLVFVLAADDGNESREVATLVILYVLTLVLPVLYYTVLQGGERGATYGKRAMGIRVVREDGSRLGYGKAFGRYGIQVILGILTLPLIADYLWPLWDPRNQSLHDKAVATLVVRD